jgi:hypothetical protein
MNPLVWSFRSKPLINRSLAGDNRSFSGSLQLSQFGNACADLRVTSPTPNALTFILNAKFDAPVRKGIAYSFHREILSDFL